MSASKEVISRSWYKTNKALLIEMAQTWAKLAEQDKIAEQERTKFGKDHE